ncbi:hypothetical protein PI125_g19065 [Phytophthora idaei]|nr:hypothetical protein PI125_g19065 [Phytophthora idaei]
MKHPAEEVPATLKQKREFRVQPMNKAPPPTGIEDVDTTEMSVS